MRGVDAAGALPAEAGEVIVQSEGNSASGQHSSWQSRPRMPTPWNREAPQGQALVHRPREGLPSVMSWCEGPKDGGGGQESESRVLPAQRVRPRGLSGVGGSAGAGSGAPSYPFTSPKRDPLVQSSRACSISCWVRATKFHHIPRIQRFFPGQRYRTPSGVSKRSASDAEESPQHGNTYARPRHGHLLQRLRAP